LTIHIDVHTVEILIVKDCFKILRAGLKNGRPPNEYFS
jgi:hypothetical protein